MVRIVGYGLYPQMDIYCGLLSSCPCQKAPLWQAWCLVSGNRRPFWGWLPSPGLCCEEVLSLWISSIKGKRIVVNACPMCLAAEERMDHVLWTDLPWSLLPHHDWKRLEIFFLGGHLDYLERNTVALMGNHLSLKPWLKTPNSPWLLGFQFFLLFVESPLILCYLIGWRLLTLLSLMDVLCSPFWAGFVLQPFVLVLGL